MSVTAFYPEFSRHAHGEGLKGHSTHYCPGCGHGLIHKYLAEAIDELGIQDDTVLVSPVGCAVFLYYYLDVGNTQAAHGRAPAVALGHKLANPRATVIAYQGDGDLASIGLAEIIQAAQAGLPITVVFVNNAIYGMTGGQMAPTTLMGQWTTTSPQGRQRLMGLPLRVSEMLAQLDGPVYIERVALFDNKQRYRAKKAILKAVRLQTEGKGFALVEVLSECPTHLKKTPREAEEWVRDEMLPVFPLGVKKELEAEDGFQFGEPVFESGRVLDIIGAGAEEAPRFAAGRFPAHIHPEDIAVKLAGAGGDGAQTAGLLLSRAAINEGFDSTHIPSYGPESRGGTSYADVHIARREVLSPSSPEPHLLVAFNAPSLEKFAPQVAEGGTLVFDSSAIKSPPAFPRGVRAYGVPFTQIAYELGRALVKNVVALGALQAACGLFPEDTFFHVIRSALKSDCAMIPLNEEAFRRGHEALCRQDGMPRWSSDL
ncbi:MAG TPA: 2-oxoacid:acceptor oxidoreductase family protein [Acidobacteriota bacterium]|nr:2-oxoacid:acceptor oxidoreductase family protein [Acidobacteriota bacterium]